MTNKKLQKKLNKVIDKYYHLYGFMYQHLYVRPMEVMDRNSCCFDIYLWDDKKKEFGPYLFEIQNYNAFEDVMMVPVGTNHFKPNKFIKTWDGVKASFTPMYMNGVYTLPKFTNISKEDILNCTRHFIKEVLDNYFVWNIFFGNIEEENDKQLEFDFIKNGI